MNAKRPLPKHPLTYLALGVLGYALFYCQTQLVWHKYIVPIEKAVFRGWPFDVFTQPTAAAISNATASLAMLASTCWVVESCLTRPGRRLQIRLATLLALVAVIGALLAWMRMTSQSQYLRCFGWDVLRISPVLRWHPWHVRGPIWLGLGATFYTAGCIATRVAVRLWPRSG